MHIVIGTILLLIIVFFVEISVEKRKGFYPAVGLTLASGIFVPILSISNLGIYISRVATAVLAASLAIMRRQENR